MSQKIKAPNDKNRSFLWAIVALVVICVLFIGFMVFNGRKSADVDLSAADVSFSVSVEDGVVQLRSGDDNDASTAEVFEDYSCHYCAELVDVDGDSMKAALEDGDLNVDLHTVNFVSGSDPASTRTGAVAMAIADTGNAGAFWAFHEKAFEDQTTVARDWGFDELADAAEQLGVEDSVVESIRDESVVDTYKPLLDANSEELNERMDGQAATPALYVDGESYAIERDPEDPEKMKNWVPDVIAGNSGSEESDAATESESADSE
ncbi:DsbA family protein [Corynebacterium sp. AOP36-E1-14]|uniref:DsbA family protein n=1 Tax=Corynebacterium sp. AOP36-E1-14 TaxID=3457682 RepID=UPI0040334BEB